MALRLPKRDGRRWFVEWIIGVNYWHPAFRCNLSDIDGFELHHFSDQQLKNDLWPLFTNGILSLCACSVWIWRLQGVLSYDHSLSGDKGCWLVLQYTNFGRGAYAISADREAAQLAGIKVKRVRLMAFGPTQLQVDSYIRWILAGVTVIVAVAVASFSKARAWAFIGKISIYYDDAFHFLGSCLTEVCYQKNNC